MEASPPPSVTASGDGVTEDGAACENRTVKISLRPLAPQDLPGWLERSAAEYATDLVTLGATPEDARRRARESLDRDFPGGRPTGGHAVFDLVDGSGASVGYLWVGPDASEDPAAWWVWDVVVDAEHRGAGYGRQAMLLGEDYARAQGASTLGLSVFGFNTSARGLYESLGYETTSVKMAKPLV